MSKEAKLVIALTAGIFICTFISWGNFEAYVGGVGRSIITITGWNGHVSIFNIKIYNWLVSLCVLSIGGVAIGAAFGFIQNKLIYIIGQLIVLFSYAATYVYLLFDILKFELGPGILLISIAAIWLTRYYIKDFSNSSAQQRYDT